MSDSNYGASMGLGDILAFDEGGWAHERIPFDELVAASLSGGARAEDASDLLSADERERAEFKWTEAGILNVLREAEVAEAAAIAAVASVGAAAAATAAAAARESRR
jgi:hypothetical protein